MIIVADIDQFHTILYIQNSCLYDSKSIHINSYVRYIPKEVCNMVNIEGFRMFSTNNDNLLIPMNINNLKVLRILSWNIINNIDVLKNNKSVKDLYVDYIYEDINYITSICNTIKNLNLISIHNIHQYYEYCAYHGSYSSHNYRVEHW